jgi:hypothetical protein
VCCAALGQSPLHSAGAKLQQLLDLKVQQWQQQQQKGQLQQVPEVREDETSKPNVVAAAAASAEAAGAEGGDRCQVLCDASGQVVEGLQAVADGHLMQRDW